MTWSLHFLSLCQLIMSISTVSTPPFHHVHEYDHSLSMNTGLTWIDVYTTRCLSQISHVSDLITEKNIIHTCQENDFGHCLFRMPYKTDTQIVGSYYLCSAINIISGVTPQIYSAFITVHDGYVLLFEFLHFHLSWTGKMCPRNRLSVSDDNGTIPREVYCGRRVPWTIISSGNKAVLRVITTGDTADISIFFSMQMISVVTKFVAHIIVHEKHQNGLHYMLGDKTEKKNMITKYTIICDPLQKIHVSINWLSSNTSRDWMRLYDGPGVLSPLISLIDWYFVSQLYVYDTSGYIMSMYHSSIHQSVHVIFKNVQNTESLTDSRSPLSAFTTNDKITGKLPLTLSILAPATRKGNTVCQIAIVSHDRSIYYPMFQIHNFNFYGPNSMESSLNDGCQYGGIKLFSYSLGNEMVKEARYSHTGCNNGDVPVPYVITANGNALLFMIAFFGGYSHGHIRVTVDFTLCRGVYVDCRSRPLLLPLVSPCHHLHFSPDKLKHFDNCTLYIKPTEKMLGPSTLTLHFKERDSFTQRIACELPVVLAITKFSNWPYKLLKIIGQYQINMIKRRFHMREAFLIDLHLEIPKCRYNKYDSYLKLNRASCQHVNYNSPDVTLIMDKTCWGKGEKFGAFLPETTQYLVMPSRNERTYILLYYDSSCPDECRNHTVQMIELNKEQRAVFNYTSRIAPDGHTYLQSNINYDGILLKIVPEFIVCQTYCRGTIYLRNHRIQEVEHVIRADALTKYDNKIYKKRRYL